ncbi:MAG: type I-E CRISPR-associated protein Cse2/CasB [Desulfovibrionaceae bacterium]
MQEASEHALETDELSFEGPPPEAPAADSLNKAVASLAGKLGADYFPKGDLAQLRRGDRGAPPPSAFWRLYLDLVADAPFLGARDEDSWRIILQCMAIMAPNIHNPERRLGRVLAGLMRANRQPSLESRFLKLLSSRGRMLREQVRHMARLLASRNLSVDWVQLAQLILEDAARRSERIRRNMARDFYIEDRKNSSKTVDIDHFENQGEAS